MLGWPKWNSAKLGAITAGSELSGIVGNYL